MISGGRSPHGGGATASSARIATPSLAAVILVAIAFPAAAAARSIAPPVPLLRPTVPIRLRPNVRRRGGGYLPAFVLPASPDSGSVLCRPVGTRVSGYGEGGGGISGSAHRRAENVLKAKKEDWGASERGGERTPAVGADADADAVGGSSVGEEADGSGGGQLCVRFSRSFQRHVVYRPLRGRPSLDPPVPPRLYCRYDDGCSRVVGSFPFLEEAMASHPDAKVVRLSDVAHKRDRDGHPRSVVAGMGTTPTSSVCRTVVLGEEDDFAAGDGDGEVVDDDDDGHDDVTFLSGRDQRAELKRRGNAALRYLSSLTASLVVRPVGGGEGAESVRGIEDRISSVLRDRLGMERLQPHSFGTVKRNLDRVTDLLTRAGGGTASASPAHVGSGLALTERAVRNLVSYFPEVCLYDYRDVEERIGFLTAPMPPSGVMEGLLGGDAPRREKKAMGRRRKGEKGTGKNAEIDCEC